MNVTTSDLIGGRTGSGQIGGVDKEACRISSLERRMDGGDASQGSQAASTSWKMQESWFQSFQKEVALLTLCLLSYETQYLTLRTTFHRYFSGTFQKLTSKAA